MCVYAAAASDIITRISGTVYPGIHAAITAVSNWLRESELPGAASMQELIFTLKEEFDSLSNYETKLVFPAILRVMGTEGNLPVNISELQQLTLNKVRHVNSLAAELAVSAVHYTTGAGHPLPVLLTLLQQSFCEVHNDWQSLLDRWQRREGCQCRLQSSTEHQHQS